jgi:predicted pyridoxine 5'-phosphate oxidase superfamily flavin-nucleotide-binding protein
VIEDDPELLARLMPAGYDAQPEQALLIHVHAWDSNCPQHIPQRLEASDVAAALAARDDKIKQLEAELRRLRSAIDSASAKTDK